MRPVKHKIFYEIPKDRLGREFLWVSQIAKTTLGLKNLQRVADMLLTATTSRPGEPYSDLEEVYSRMLGQ